jgi:hypothetical protein
MKTNPFYALSVSAMLLGCWLLSEALHLQAGQLGGLLLLMAVLQLYEGLLVGLGAFLVRTGRAPRDGVAVLALESVFLMDAPLLAAEGVTVDARAGTAIALGLAALVVAKLAWVRHAVPGVLSARAAGLLGTQAGLVLAVPVLATHLASARVFGPIALYGVWWATLALPFAQRLLRDETRAGDAGSTRTHTAWTWVPAALTLLHLWAVGYIHAIDFRPALIAPILLGLAATAGRDELARKVALPGLAVLVSLGQGSSLGFHLIGADGPLVSPLCLAMLGVAATWGYLAWRDRERWLAMLALGGGVAGLLGASASSLSTGLGRAVRFLDSLLPRDAFGWGLLTVIAAFVLLAAGARRSLAGEPSGGPQGPSGPPRQRWRESSAIALSLGIFALSAMAGAFEAFPLGHPRQLGPAGLASLAAAAAFVMSVRARGRAAREAKDAAGQQLAGLAMAASALGFLLAMMPLSASSPHPGRSESVVIGDVRTVLSAQAAYQAANGGFFDSRLDCLRAPAGCIPAYPATGPRFLDETLSRLGPKSGYARSFVPGPPAEGDPAVVSRSSTGSYAYVAVPTEPGYSGVRGFCGDSSGVLCFTTDGRAPGVAAGRCDLSTCEVLQ